jgi:hypothetical protein
MAGIEPASERLEPRTSTSVADLLSREGKRDQQKLTLTSHSNPKALFRMARGVTIRHFSILAPVLSPAEERDRQTWPHVGSHYVDSSLAEIRPREGELRKS